ncbi:hypothetical protein [Candidatus Electrothrix sp.]|uniref:hypothetical protein n=1 Tax=Candidatus Electrothrix sp. TaxID=2170559 RepID=UPI0040573445
MLKLKKISVKLALIVSFTAFFAVQYAQAQSIKLPLTIDDPDIQNVVEDIRMNVGPNPSIIQEMMIKTRDIVKAEQVKRLPLMPQFRNTIGNAVSTKVMAATRTATMNAQMNAMQDPMNPEGVPNFIAPKFNFE